MRGFRVNFVNATEIIKQMYQSRFHDLCITQDPRKRFSKEKASFHRFYQLVNHNMSTKKQPTVLAQLKSYTPLLIHFE